MMEGAQIIYCDKLRDRRTIGAWNEVLSRTQLPFYRKRTINASVTGNKVSPCRIPDLRLLIPLWPISYTDCILCIEKVQKKALQ